MKKTVLKILGIIFFASISGIIALHVYLLDGIHGWFFSSVLDFEEDTVYASGDTDKGFRQVKPGMDSQDVVKLLGTPLEVVSHHYSGSLLEKGGKRRKEQWNCLLWH